MNEVELGQALDGSFLSEFHPRRARREYSESLREPDLLVFHGSPGKEEARERWKMARKDIKNLADEFEVADTKFLIYEGEYESLRQGKKEDYEERLPDTDEVVSEYDLELEVSDFSPYPAYKDWIPVRQITEAGDCIRSYTSRSNQRKLRRTGQLMLPHRELTVFGFRSPSDSFIRKALGEIDYHVRQKPGASEYLDSS